MKKVMIWAGLVTIAGALAVAVVAFIRIGPRNLWGMIRYDQRREGELAVGDRAPDVVLTALDGVTQVRLYEQIEKIREQTGTQAGKEPAKRPLVLIFGSYT